MNIAVKLQSHNPNKPPGMPDAWPYLVAELGSGTTPPDSDYSVMTLAGYASYKASHQSDYDTWYASYYGGLTAVSALRQQLDDRMKWGEEVTKQFRMVTMGVSDEAGLAMLGNLMDVKSCLDLGMLQAAADTLQTKDADATLDADFKDGKTLRQWFVNFILAGGPAP